MKHIPNHPQKKPGLSMKSIGGAGLEWFPYGICQIHHRGMLLSRVMGIVRLRFIFDLLMISIVAVIGITIGL